MFERIWLEVKVLWARLCGWRVIREDVHGDVNPAIVGPGEKLWILKDVYAGRTRPGLTVDGGDACVSGNIYGPGYGPDDVTCGIYVGTGTMTIDGEMGVTGNCPER